MNKHKKHLVTRQLNELIGDTIIMREALVAICRGLPTKQEAGQRTDRLIGLAVDIRDDLEHIVDQAEGMYDLRETLHSIDTALAALCEERRITPVYHDPALVGAIDPDPHDYGGDQNPRTPVVAADVPQEAALPNAPDAHRVDPGTGEGGAAKPPQNAIQEVEWPTALGLYWIRGIDGGNLIEGIAQLDADSEGRRKLYLVGTEGAIWERWGNDRLYAATPLTLVPTALLERLYDASPDSYGRASDTIHDLEHWTVDHGTAVD